MTQPDTEQLLNLADRAERGPLTPDEAARLRDGITKLATHIDEYRDMWRSNMRAMVEQEQRADRYRTAWTSARTRAEVARHVARSNRRHVAAIVPDLEAATTRAEQLDDLLRIANDTSNTSETERVRAVERADRATDAIARVRAECDRIEAAVRDSATDQDLAGGYLACLRHIRAALDPQEPQL
ncbi:hypothetical protein [Streptomyces roseicoloratus]|uniref:hypothetical protein n=1 Tax=Streptomyces roseicoloratus TaxID=2508722 RepID=UPI0010098F8E|nr:hypothetical protein [Streptomyces roseicoloratus]